MGARTLHVRCATWEQVEVFLTRKLRRGRFLSMRVPFVATIGTSLTLGLELPNELVIAIDGSVQRASPVEDAGDQPRTWIEIELAGLTEELLARIRSFTAGAEEEPTTAPVAVAPQRASTAGLAADELPEDERALFQHLSGELRRMRQLPVHDVLSIARDASPEKIRASWKALVRRHHPDLVARRNAPAITHLAEELTILSNRAYDRLRAVLVAEGRGTLVGPSLATPPGWLVGFEDIQSADAQTPPPGPPSGRYQRAASPVPMATPPPRAPTSAGQGSEAFEQRAREMLGQGDANTAREVLAAALVVYPRSKALRSLYHVATAVFALNDGELVLAQAQLETALAHHEQCVEAAQVLEHIRRHGSANLEALRKVFR